MRQALKVGLLAAGIKGLMAAQAVDRCAHLEVIATYPLKGTDEPGPDEFRQAFPEAAILVGRAPDAEALSSSLDALFIAGWQFLIESPTNTPTIVLHDSLLPDLRGFAPTVTALILGRPNLGVSAVLPGTEADSGDLLAQHAIEAAHPLHISDAFESLRPCYEKCIRDVLVSLEGGTLEGRAQDPTVATYSIWRDEADYWLDFHQPADRVLRTILALDHPYPGARTIVDGRQMTVHSAAVESDLDFAIRQPGKIWNIGESGPLVVCGSGMIRLTDIRDENGAPYIPSRPRTRFGAPTPAPM
jgi:methionyl-tRNA formyltransferase